jgi:hypothetical protein
MANPAGESSGEVLRLDFDRLQMGQRGRAKVEKKFGDALVIGRYLSLISRKAL